MDEKLWLHDLLYADDTLLIGGSEHFLQIYLDIIVANGQKYGLEMNWQKVEVLCAAENSEIKNLRLETLVFQTLLTYHHQFI